MKKIVKGDRGDCTGCAACYAICPTNAIKMQEDQNGFLHPTIDFQICCDCGKCGQVCGIKDMSLTYRYLSEKCIIGHNKKIEILASSQSGGVFPVIAEYVLEKGGAVYGASLIGVKRVEHIRIVSSKEIVQLQGSKYVQSDIKSVYVSIQSDLKNEKWVLFVGTPCQCAGIKKYCEVKRLSTDQLILVDLVCHGVPSIKIWVDYVKYIEKKYGGKIQKALFRDKSFGWTSYYESFVINGEKIVEEKYKGIFNSNACLRESCYTCVYSSLNRVGDITIGDAWSRNREKQYHKNSRGESIILLNSEKGKKIFEDFSEKIEYWTAELEEFLQPNLDHPSETKENREYFWKDYKRFGFGYILFLYGFNNKINRMSKVLRRVLLNIFHK